MTDKIIKADGKEVIVKGAFDMSVAVAKLFNSMDPEKTYRLCNDQDQNIHWNHSTFWFVQAEEI